MLPGDSYQPDLVYDIGAHIGQDSEFYLKKGFRVIVIEADPSLAAAIQARLSPYPAERWVLLTEGIGAVSGKLPFYLNHTFSEWNSFREDHGTRGGQFEVIAIPVRHISDVLAAYGVPYFMKLDVEGWELPLLQSLRDTGVRPRYISSELGNAEQNYALGTIDCLESMGYKRFKLVSQAYDVPGFKLPKPGLEGAWVEHEFVRDSSGPFGEEAPGDWLDAEAARQAWGGYLANPRIDDWFDIHAA
jgi:FkbM family methyltransferase